MSYSGLLRRQQTNPAHRKVRQIVGGVLSPLLSNILLTDLDRELERRGHRFCRYADDCNLYVGSKAAGPGTRNRKLQGRGIDPTRAWKSASNGRGPWWNSGASHMKDACPNRFFDVSGLVSLLET